MKSLFDLKPLVITALHLPEFRVHHQPLSMQWLEDYVLQNLAVFSEGGIPAVILQDETLTPELARPENIAILSTLGRIARQAFPHLHLGIILQAHDPYAPLAVAHACGASFVRIKVYVGTMLKSEGIQNGCGISARDYRFQLGREDIMILADVHDRTGYPLAPVPMETAAQWAVNTGADGLILTGYTYQESLDYLRTVRQVGIKQPLLLGGGAHAENIAEVLKAAGGVIVSSALKRDEASSTDIIQWDRDKILRFMDAARSAISA